ncbi:MAG: hypothetical protein UT30_C0025G0011 [Candidatus Uhrbacteria bacterium GW2011_GWF2_39_13]|uniref:DUF1559 domain-containing protein n=1 Tax=Candidatus Uhrbacteria bacterium GW2011_GWF2_39_13 TaxID=1618995 RepID=A0A0G0MHW0_9BACT|nr:MAG: hypothetical protein UT30_C0025G0011 [Candidatus Uhrbacteria bacterium GW2011_GWF2_39_13]
MKNLRKIFTLIELLIVIVIIIIMAGLLLPALKKAKDVSKRIVCTNNLKQLGLCLNMYAEDHGGYYPCMYKADDTYKQWTRKLWNYDYIKNPNIFFCPSLYPYKWGVLSESASISSTYGLRREGYTDGYYYSYKNINTPSTQWLLADSVYQTLTPLCQSYTIRIIPSGSTGAAHLRHGLSANTLFADNHVEIEKKGFFTDDNYASYP